MGTFTFVMAMLVAVLVSGVLMRLLALALPLPFVLIALAFLIPAVPLPVAFAIAAIVSLTDPVAVKAILAGGAAAFGYLSGQRSGALSVAIQRFLHNERSLSRPVPGEAICLM